MKVSETQFTNMDASEDVIMDTGIRSLICKLWNFKLITLMVKPASLFSAVDMLDNIKSQLCDKIDSRIGVKSTAAIPQHFIRLVQGGKPILNSKDLNLDQTLHIELKGSLKGGKGGFGSLLRSVKPKAQQDDNFEACRDLSGRRLRHINNEQRIREFH